MDQKPISQTAEMVLVPQVVPVRRLAELLGVPVVRIIQLLLNYGVRATINESVDFETAAIVADEVGVAIALAQTASTSLDSPVTEPSAQEPRPPVVTVMGHVDHGKTRLLDTIRRTNVIATESGGITQHIGAYQVKVNDDKGRARALTFLDTPGHEAFSAMRAHGASITDIVVLVIAADDGVKPQTLEAISHARAANVPIIVALTKVDKPEADLERSKRQLADINLLPEEWGGQTVVVPVSSVTGQGVPELLEMILLTADVNQQTAAVSGPSNGVVIESHLAAGLGPVATVLVQQGRLAVGDVLVFQTTYAKVRSMEDHLAKRVNTALPATPIRISGLKAVPESGELYRTISTEKEAREIIEKAHVQRNVRSVKGIGLSELSQAIAAGEFKELTIVIKADTQGSLEAIRNSLAELSTAEVAIKLVHEGLGEISESDINMAVASRAAVVAFRVTVPPAIRKFAGQKGIKISTYDIIYRLIDDLFDALSGLLEPELVEIQLGQFEVVKVFKASKTGGIIGGRVIEGVVEKGSQAKIIRAGEPVGEAKISRVQREQTGVDKVEIGSECGLLIESTVIPKPGDILELTKQEEHMRRLERT